MEGFFSKTELQKIKSSHLSCLSCKLYKGCQSPKMEPYGQFRQGIMILGEAPGETEDELNLPWQGKSGRLLKKTLRKFGIDLFEDCVSINTVNCRPPDNRTPTTFEIDCCRKVKVDKAIEEYSPKLIIALGSVAIKSLIEHRWKKNFGSINKWRGWTIPDQDYKAWICPTYHPSFILRSEKFQEIKTIWELDIERAISKVDIPRTKHRKPNIQVITDLSVLREIKSTYIAPDYETTGLKPQATGHEIVVGSVAYSENDVYVFQVPKQSDQIKPFLELLQNRNIYKIASNLKYEDTWTIEIFGVSVNLWGWDTMLAAHILDNRSGVSGLKFQSYVNLGVVDYDSEVAPFLQADRANDFNRIKSLMQTKEGRDKVMKYCALDSIYEYRLAMLQMPIIGWDHLNI